MSVYDRADSIYWWMTLENAPPGTPRRRSTGVMKGVTVTERKLSKADADRVYHAASITAARVQHGIAPTETPSVTTFETFVAWYKTHEIPQHRGAYRELQILPRLVAAFGACPLNDITAARVVAWRTKRLITPTVVKHYGGPRGRAHTFPCPSARTVNREVNFLQQVLSAAVKTGQLATSPLVGLSDLDTAPIRRRTASHDEEQRVLAALAVDDRAIYLIGRDGLVRLGDILDVRRAEDHGTTLDIRDPKNRQPLTIPISTRLRAALDAVPVDPAQPEWYFPHRRKAKTDQARTRGYIKALKRACGVAGVPYGRAVKGLTFHWATRTTGATRMIRQGGDGVIADVQKIGGWKDISVLLEIYQQTVTADMHRAVELGSAAPVTAIPPPPPLAKLRRVK
jgi:integrase